jgi:outer membrane protein assembly factor BamA
LIRNLLITLFVVASLFSTSAIGEVGMTIQLSGNQRTNSEHLRRIVRVCLARIGIGSLGNIESLQQCVLNSKLFSAVTIRRAASGIIVEVVERWTLIPIPFMQTGSDGNRKFGFYLLETNFLGRGKFLALGGHYSDRGRGFLFYLNNQSIAFSPYGAEVGVQKVTSRYDLIEKDSLIADTYSEQAIIAGFRLGYSVNNTSLHLGPTFKDQRFDLNLGDREINKESNKTVALTSRVQFDHADYKLFFEQNYKFNLFGVSEFYRQKSDPFVHQVYGDLTFGWPTFLDHALVMRSGGGFMVGGNNTDAFRMGSKVGFRGSRAETLWLDRYLTVSADYLIPLSVIGYGTWTYGLFLDHGTIRFRGGESGVTQFSAWGNGIYLYLKEIAVPGVGIEVGQNDRFSPMFFSLALGLAI